MEEKKISLSRLFIIFFLAVEYRFFFLIPLPGFIAKSMTYHNKLLVFSLAVLMLILYIPIRNKEYVFKKYIFLFLGISILSYIYCISVYPYEYKEVMVPMAAYMLIILYFPLVKFLKKNFFYFLSALTIFNVISCSILIIQAVIYNKMHLFFLKIYEFSSIGNIILRNGDVRITYMGTIISFSAVVSLGILLQKKIKKNVFMHVSNLLFSVIYFYYVSQTRAYVLSVVGTAVLIVLISSITSKKNKIIKFLLVIFSIIILFFSTGLYEYVYELINPIFSGAYMTDGSYYARFESIDYFLRSIKEKPFTGLGLIVPNEYSPVYNIIHGPSGHAYYSDVGILGSVGKFGVFSGIWYLALLIRIWLLNKEKKSRVIDSLLYFIMITSMTLCVLDPQRILFLAMSLAVIDVIYSNKNEALKL